MTTQKTQQTIFELGLKISSVHEAMVKAGMVSHPSYEVQLQKLLAVVNNGRKPENIVEAINQHRIAEALGYPPNVIHTYRRAEGTKAQIGKFLDYCSIMGVGPEEHDIDELFHMYKASRALERVEEKLFDVLDSWRSDTPNFRCWIALAGCTAQLESCAEQLIPILKMQNLEWESCRPPPHYHGNRGLAATAFQAIYHHEFGAVEFSLLKDAHWIDQFPDRADARRFGRDLYFALGVRNNGEPSEPIVIETTSRPKIDKLSSLDNISTLFESELNAQPESPHNVREKSILFGGRSHSEGLGWKASDYVSAGYSFPRENSDDLAKCIESDDANFSSYRMVALPGCGLSLALAQLVERLCLNPNAQVLWILDDPDKTRRVIRELPEFMWDILSNANTSNEKRYVFVIDDASSLAPRERQRLINEMSRCEVKAQMNGGLNVTFVLGVKGDEGDAETGFLSSDRVWALRLTERDQNACYSFMASKSPVIIEGHPGGLTGLLSTRPYGESFGDDPQAFIDYLLKFGRATKEALDYWIVPEISKSPAILHVARSQMLGLTFQESVAKRFFSKMGLTNLQTSHQIASSSNFLYESATEWQGVGLSCAWRARTILASAGALSKDELVQHYAQLVRISISHFRDSNVQPDSALDYGRHIIQRLVSRKKRYWFPDIDMVSEGVLVEVLPEILNNAESWSGKTNAKWAGTLSDFLYRRNDMNYSPNFNTEELAKIIQDMCYRMIIEIKNGIKLTSDGLVPLLKAVSKIIKSRLISKRESIKIFNKTLNHIRPDLILMLITDMANSGGLKIEYRLNEIVHAYSSLVFTAALRSIDMKKRRKTVIGLNRFLIEIEIIFERYGVAFDTQNWLLRARCSWIDGNDPRVAGGRHPGQEIKAYALRRARACVLADPVQQSRWRQDVEDQISTFIEETPALAGQFLQIREDRI